MPAKEYLDGLSNEVRVKFFALFKTLADLGKIANDEKFHHSVGRATVTLGGKSESFSVGEFKVHTNPGYRILACHDRDEWVLTHGFRKCKKSQVKIQVGVAERIFQEDREHGASR